MPLSADELTAVNALQQLGAWSAANAIQNSRYESDNAAITSRQLLERVAFLEKHQYKERFILGFSAPLSAFIAFKAIEVLVSSNIPAEKIPFPMGFGGAVVVLAFLAGAVISVVAGLVSWTPPKTPEAR